MQAAELMDLMNLFTTGFEDVVNYDDFMKILYKFGDMPTGATGYQMPPEL